MKAILVFDFDESIKNVEECYAQILWHDTFPIELQKKVYFKPLPDRMEHIDSDLPFIQGFRNGFNTCIEIMEIYGDYYVVQKEKE